MCSVVVIGLGTIGSALVPLLARIAGVFRMILVDPDTYTVSNVENQAIDTSAAGRPKVEVQAKLIRAINPQIRVDAIQERVENVPLGRLDGSILMSCVDNRNARQAINRIACRYGNPWLDAAVDPASLVRVNGYMPGASTPCLECAWHDESYDLLNQNYPCDAGSVEVPATGTPVELGALAASLQAGEARKILDDAAASTSLFGAQFMLDTGTYTRHLNHFERNEHCRCDHQVWSVDVVSLCVSDSTLADLFDAATAGSNPAISLEGQIFTMYLDCIACGTRSTVGLSLFGRLSDSDRTCDCGGRMFAPGFFSFEAIHRSELSPANLDRKLAAVGFQSGDVITVTEGPGPVRHIEITEERSSD